MQISIGIGVGIILIILLIASCVVKKYLKKEKKTKLLNNVVSTYIGRDGANTASHGRWYHTGMGQSDSDSIFDPEVTTFLMHQFLKPFPFCQVMHLSFCACLY